MEVHKFYCDCCETELDENRITITQHYIDRQYDGLDESYYNNTINNHYHLCPKCWERIKLLVIKPK